jgi:hypothetical protein
MDFHRYYFRIRHSATHRSTNRATNHSAIGLVVLALLGVALGPVAGDSAVVGAQQLSTNAPLVFDGVTVIDVQKGRLLPAQRVVIVGNRIRAVGGVGAVRVPTGSRVVNARGKYLIPGLWDMHTHAFESHATDLFNALLIANGITGIRDASSPVPLDSMLLWRREILAGTRVGPPRQLLSGPAIDDSSTKYGKDICEDAEAAHICVADSADARHVVDSLKAAGADILKTYQLGRKLYFTIAAEARRVGIPFGGHLIGAPPAMGGELITATAIEASDSGAGLLDHVNTAGDLDGRCWVSKDSWASKDSRPSVEQCKPVAERFRRNNTWWVPTLISHWVDHDVQIGLGGPATHDIITRFDALGHAFWNGAPLSLDWLRDTANRARSARLTHPTTPAALGAVDTNTDGEFLRIVQRVGLPILAGTDVAGVRKRGEEPPGGFDLHAELALIVAMGMTPLEALQAATLNPAKFLHGTDSLGTVASGKLADLVLLDADPLTDITNTTTIRAVVANGRYFDRAALDRLMTDAQAKAKQ